MPRLKFLAVSISIPIVVATPPAAAQTIPSPYTFIELSREWAIFAGRSDINPGQLGLGPRDGTAYGGRFSIAFGGATSVDLSGTLFSSTREVRDVNRPVDNRVLGKSNIDVVLLDARLRLNLTGQRAWHKLQPFVAFGGGVALAFSVDRIFESQVLMPPDEQYAFGTRFTGTFGGGVNYHVSSKLSLRLEGLVNLWKVQTPSGWLTVDADPLGENPDGEWVSAKSLTLGASWRR